MNCCRIFIFLFYLTLIACTTKPESTSENSSSNEATLMDTDSVRFANALDSALSLASHIKSDSFTREFTSHSDSSYSIQVKVELRNYPDYKHLTVRRLAPSDVRTDVFIQEGDNFKNILHAEHGSMTYISDTLADVNGDQLSDFLIHWYPASGCCRRNQYDVYLLRKDGTFSESYSFINPTFFPKEKIIRGVLYGHQEEVGLYKYRWKENSIDTIEFIYKNPDKRNTFIRTKKMFLFDTPEKDKIHLNTLPKEYQTIEDIDWFKNDQ